MSYRMVGFLGMILPILDVWKCGWKIPPSISESYYLGSIVPFVLILGSLGIVFICNYGYDETDRVMNRISGFAALGVLCFPCNQYPTLHYIYAIILFVSFALMCLFVFTGLRSPNSYDLGYANIEVLRKNKKRRNIIYITCGILIMIGMCLIHFLKLFWCEVLMLESFGFAYLFVQGKLILRDENINHK